MEMQAKKKERKKKKAANNPGLSKARNIKPCTSGQTALTSEVDVQQFDKYTAANCAESSNSKINETRAIKSTFIEKASNNPGPDEGDTRGHTEISQITEKRCKPGRAVKQWKEELVNVFEKGDISEKPVVEVRMEGDPPYICNIKQLDKARKIKLRTSSQTLTSDKVELQQFDPNFFSKTTIWCRVPGCHQSKERSCCKKEDLFVCEVHRKSLKDNLDKMCNERNVDTSMKYDIEDFKDYTSLIGIMENAYISLSKKNLPSDRKIFGKKSGIFQEVMLNMRNYLIAVNTLLNPVPENVSTAIRNPYIVFSEILRMIIEDDDAIRRLRELVGLLRDVIEAILHYFGNIFCWTHLSQMNNPGGKVGFGVGGLLGLFGFRSGLVIGTITTAGGATFGGYIGSGLYQMWYGQNDNDYDEIPRHQQCDQGKRRAERQDDVDEDDPLQESHVYVLTGNPCGDFCLLLLSDLVL